MFINSTIIIFNNFNHIRQCVMDPKPRGLHTISDAMLWFHTLKEWEGRNALSVTSKKV